MRRILRKIASGVTKDLGDTSTLLDPTVVEKIITFASFSFLNFIVSYLASIKCTSLII